jgi:hypothetical protein
MTAGFPGRPLPLARGKLPKVALVAVMRKLLIAIYFATHRRPFTPPASARREPRMKALDRRHGISAEGRGGAGQPSRNRRSRGGAPAGGTHAPHGGSADTALRRQARHSMHLGSNATMERGR